MYDLQIVISAIIGVGIIASIKHFTCHSDRFTSFNNNDDDGCISNDKPKIRLFPLNPLDTGPPS